MSNRLFKIKEGAAGAFYISVTHVVRITTHKVEKGEEATVILSDGSSHRLDAATYEHLRFSNQDFLTGIV